ncbi:MAG: stage II sporulation protein M [Candidatus Hydrothermarchaeota archaeon]
MEEYEKSLKYFFTGFFSFFLVFGLITTKTTLLYSLLYGYVESRIVEPISSIGEDVLSLFLYISLNNVFVVFMLIVGSISFLSLEFWLMKFETFRKYGRGSLRVREEILLMARRISPDIKDYKDVILYVTPATILFLNGGILGGLFGCVLVQEGISELIRSFLTLFPHGLIEIPAIIIAGGRGFINAKNFSSYDKPEHFLHRAKIYYRKSFWKDSFPIVCLILIGSALEAIKAS